MQINGIELEFNVYDVNTIKKYDEAIEGVEKSSEQISKRDDLDSYQKLNGMMAAIRFGFDHLFGPGIGEKVCGTTDASVTAKAYKELLEEENRQEENYKNMMKDIAELRAKRVVSVEALKERSPEIQMSPKVLNEAPMHEVTASNDDITKNIIQASFHESVN